MPAALLNGITLWYEEHGAGLPVVFTHAFYSGTRMWDPQMAALAARYRMIAWDMRGHGGTDSPPRPEDYSHELAVEDLRCLLGHLRVERAAFVGLSTGGYVTLRFALAHPATVAALVLCDTGPGFRSPASRQAWNDNALRSAEALETRGFAGLSRSPEILAALPSQRSASGMALSVRGILAQRDSAVIDQLGSITAPTLVIVGEHDTPLHTAADVMTRAIPNARRATIPGGGHAPNIDQADAYNAVLLDFLDAVATAGGIERSWTSP